jgi:hypothetical protein
MTHSSQPQDRSDDGAAPGDVVEAEAASPAWRRRLLGDIHVGVLDGNARQVPGTGTANGEKAIAKAMTDVLDRVRRSIRERSARPTPRPSARA